MSEIKLITKEDVPTLEYSELDWDVEVHGVPYQVIRVPGFVHCTGGPLDFGEGNNFWAYPLNEEITFENLVEFNGHWGAAWGVEYTPTNYLKTKWGETSVQEGRKLIITRNGKPFYDDFMTLHQALAYITDGLIDEHPLELNTRDYDKKAIGRKVWYRSEPGIITHCYKGRVTIAPDGMEEFSIPKEFENEDLLQDEPRTSVTTTIFDEQVWWFRH